MFEKDGTIGTIGTDLEENGYQERRDENNRKGGKQGVTGNSKESK